MDSKLSFFNKLNKSEIFEDLFIDFGNEEIIIDFLPKGIEFINCTIKAKSLSFRNIINEETSLSFENCKIDTRINIENCTINSVVFENINKLNELSISGNLTNNNISKINNFQFLNNDISNILDTKFRFSDCHFIYEFSFYDINHTLGFFIFSNIKMGDENFSNIKYQNFVFSNSTITNASFQENDFQSAITIMKCNFQNIDVEKIKRYKNTIFLSNTFNKIGFIECNFNNICHFVNCNFTQLAYFEKIQNMDTELLFFDCIFNKNTSFKDSKLKQLIIDKCIFNSISSFQDTTFKTISIDTTIFEKIAFFDNIKINEIENCNKRTIRNIKLQLQKAENKIDFNHFRNFELTAHYNELTFKNNFKDKSILWATKWSSNFGNWVWAFWFTIFSGILWYCILYRIENSGTFSTEQLNTFFIGLFRFFLITDFYNPLIESPRTYLNDVFSWIPFLLGKIFIAFGIYEMIQSFRKFKA